MSEHEQRISDRVDIGSGCFYTRVFHDEVWVGIWEWHACSANEAPGLHGDGLTPGWIQFDTGDAPPPVWPVASRYPLTLDGSILCRSCGHHGYIREDRWVPA